MNEQNQKAFWQQGFFRERLKFSEWKWWAGLIFLAFTLIGGTHSIYAGTFGEYLGPGTLLLVFVVVTRHWLKERQRLREKSEE